MRVIVMTQQVVEDLIDPPTKGWRRPVPARRTSGHDEAARLDDEPGVDRVVGPGEVPTVHVRNLFNDWPGETPTGSHSGRCSGAASVSSSGSE